MVTVTSVEYLGEYRLRLSFSDGAVGEIDLGDQLWGEMFSPLKDEKVFSRVAVDAEAGTIVWPNGADVDPEGLREAVQLVQRAS